MTALIPELAVVTTGVGAVMIRLGLDRGLLQPRNAPDPKNRRDRSFAVVRRVPIVSDP